ncbi:Stk1 family PASTA domain-containing Ser/Thr kinase [Alteribacter populi]|uniref:Stk1 family PASTA domain-containing Ser/Thr kinase n=1 Tax=Alteribacter populi TaxID=2011011 RepID=UPI000BBA5EB1|nr:Stk1 family PASTA domain-containing Ser/Thr kinase [Alteribacter populi]
MIGKRINDRYKIIKSVGGGGMADVYLAHDMILNRDVAVKVLKEQFSQDEDFIRRFRREAQAATSLSHPNVVNIYDVGEEDRLYYLVMEYIEGPTLKEYIQQKGSLEVDEAVGITAHLTSAIAHAHDNQIIHRDIKPHNILIGHDGTAKVTDFGIARAISEATITHTNSILGSVHYLSPEQARGGHVTYKSDIYSLGIVMYEMLAGEVPFSGDTAVSVAIKHLQTPLPSIRQKYPDIPQSVENVIMKATAKDSFNRYSTAFSMGEDLDTVLSPLRADEEKLDLRDAIDHDQTKAIPIVGHDSTDKTNEEETMVVGTPTQSNANQSQSATPPQGNKKKKGWKKWLTTAVLLLLLLFGATAIAFTWLPQWLHVDEVTIPDDLVGKSYEEALQELIDMNLRVERELDYDEEAEEGTVIGHTPAAGRTVKVETQVTLRVSEGAEPVSMSDFTGRSLSAIENELEDFKEVEISTEENADEDDETVLEQSPAPEDQVIPKDTVVKLTVSEKPVMTMANLMGGTRDEVSEYISEHQMISAAYEEDFHPSIEEGKVISQNPEWGSEIDEQTEVTVVFSKGPEPEPESDENNEEEIEPTFAEVPFRVTVPEESGNEGHGVLIAVIDSTTEEQETVVDTEITETEVFNIPMQLDEQEDKGYIILYHNDEEHAESPFEYTYDEVKQYETDE